jgi:hypothetical protein
MIGGVVKELVAFFYILTEAMSKDLELVLMTGGTVKVCSRL